MKTLSIFLVALVLSGAPSAPGALAGMSQQVTDRETAPMDCSFTIKGTFNGIAVDVEVTVSGVSLIECAILKAGVKKAIQ